MLLGVIKQLSKNLLACLLSFALIAILVIENSIAGKIYLLGTALLCIQTIYLLSRRILFSLSLSSLLITLIWFASEAKWAFVGTRLFVQDFHDIATTLTVAKTYAWFGIPILLLIITLIIYQAAQEKPILTERKYNILSFAILLICFISINALYQPNIALARGEKNALPIFIQSAYRLKLKDYTLAKNNFCCLKANRKAEVLTQKPKLLPNIIFVLEESSFDPNTLKHFSSDHSLFPEKWPLTVHSVGGLTWVQEVGVLHGVPPTLYGASWPISNIVTTPYYSGRLPHILKTAGYQNTTITSVPKAFYGIETFHTQLGMDTLIDCLAQAGCRNKPWPQVHDQVFFDTAIKRLKENTEKPQFLLVETIRQHSPHNQNNHPFNKKLCNSNLSDLQCNVMQEYQNRFVGADADFHRFINQVKDMERPTLVIAFGDHIPSDVNILFSPDDFLTETKYQTFFTVWDSEKGFVTHEIMAKHQIAKHSAIDVAFLDSLALDYTGFDSTYLSDKLAFMRQNLGAYQFN